VATDDELDQLRAEVARLRELVGPNEKSYVQLQIDLLGARDAAIGAEAELGTVRGYNQALEAEVERLERDFVWFRHNVVERIKGSSVRSSWLGRMMSRFTGR
jgi:hypothetical protein